MENKRGFKGVWIPKEIWLDKELSITEKVMIVEIDSLDNESGCFASNAHFAELFNLSKDRVSKIISSLSKRNYIKVNLVRKNGNSIIEKRVIKVIKKFDTPIVENNYTPSQKQLGGIVESNYPPIVENAEGNNTYINNTINNTYTDEFEDIWKLYPKKVGKPKAMSAYVKARKNGEKFETIKQGVIAYANHCQSIKDSKYIAHGSTWFNNQRWTDELTTHLTPQEPPKHIPNDYDMKAYESLLAGGAI